LIGPEDHPKVTQFLSALAKEASDIAATWITRAEQNHDIYTYGATPPPASGKCISNQIQDSVNAIVDFQTKDPPIKTLNPVERGEPGEVYYFTPPDPVTGQSTVQGPFTPDVAAQMQQQTVAVGMDEMGQPLAAPVYNPSGFVTIDDQSTADFFQKQLDVYWKRGRLDKAVRLVVHKSNIYGYYFPVYEWDRDYHRPRLWIDITLRDFYIDPTRQEIEDSAYFGVDWWLDAEQAKTMFPHLADIIDERARTGTPERPDSTTQFGFNVDRVGAFKRNTICLRVFWLRNQPCPYEADEALAAGLLERRQIPLGDPSQIIPNEEAQFPKGPSDDALDQTQAGEPAPEPRDAPVGFPGGNAATDPRGQGGVSDIVPDAGPIVAAPATRDALFANGIEVTPPTKGDATTLDPNWPMYRCVRQLTAVLGLIVDDRECEYFDIPVLQAIATPVPEQPYGQGLPERMEAMQAGRGDMLTNIRDHTELHAHPVSFFSSSMWEHVPAKYKVTGASVAGMKGIIPDHDFYDERGNPRTPGVFVNPPPMNQALVDGERIFHDELTERSGNPEVLQGKPPTGVSGWQAIQLLSENASSRFGFSQQWTRDLITRLVHHVLHDLTDQRKVTVRDLRAVDSRYPEQIVSAFQRRGAMIEWDLDIEVQTGVGSSRSRKQAQAIEAHQTVSPVTGDPILSDESLAEALDYDFQQESQRNARAREQAMQVQAQQLQLQEAMNPRPAPGEKSGGAKKPGSNGDGQHSANGNGRMNGGM
jgi:hypothetical protein